MSVQKTASSPVHAISIEEIAVMAAILYRKHGPSALEVAAHFAEEHRAFSDNSRANSWDRVTSLLEKRISSELAQ